MESDSLTSADGLKAWAEREADTACPAAVWASSWSQTLELLDVVAKRLNELKTAHAALQARIAGLEASATATKGVNGAVWGGVFETNHEYKSGEIVTHAGNVWICTVGATTAIPGSDPTSWRLVLRRGKA
jgi:hypothetical protein